MDDMSESSKTVLCFAHGRDGDWQAICVDFDIAVQGNSLEDVQHMLNDAVAFYIRDANQEQEPVRNMLLNRRAPWYTTLMLTLKLIYFNIFDGRRNEAQASFPVPCPA
jgi:predicted RNase H-like HicB family nuclease